MLFREEERQTMSAMDVIGTSEGYDDSGNVFTNFLDNLRDGVVVVGPDLQIKYINDAYFTQFGVGPEEIFVGAHLRDVLRRLAKNALLGDMNKLSPDEMVEQSLRSFGRREGRVERRFLGNGRVLDIYRSHTLQDDIVSVHVDVTEAVRSQQEIERQRLYMKVLIDNMSDGLSLLDKNGRFVIFNEKMLSLYDIDPDSVYPGMEYWDFCAKFGDLSNLPPDTRQAEMEKRHRFAFDPSIISVRRRLSNGRTLHIRKTLLPEGGCVMTYRDMTADLKREEDLVHARQQAEESARSKSEFVARMSHEMRTPLNGILGVAALLDRTQLTDKQDDLVKIVSASGKVLLRLIDDILDLSKIDAETFEVVDDRFLIVDVISQCMGIVEPSATEKGLRIVLEIGKEPIAPLCGDMVRIKQILLNLLTNAIKFTEKGHVTLAVSHEAGPEGVTLTLTVTDTGVGIEDDKLDQIFNRFYQIDGTVTRKYGGAGLGLAITQKLVDAMGGAIQVDSKLGVGTSFRVKLTLQPAAAGQPR